MIRTCPAGDLGGAVWIDLIAPTEEEVERVRAATGLRVPTEPEISEIESSSRLAFEAGAYFVSTPLVAADAEGDHLLVPVGFVYAARVLITVRFGALHALDAAHEQAALKPPASAQDAVLHIFELIVDRAADHLERSGAECDDLARTAFRNDPGRAKASTKLGTALRRIGRVANAISRIRDELLGLGRIGAYVIESKIEGAPTLDPGRLKALRADIVSLTDYEGHLSAKVQFLLDATLGFINIEQNEIVKTLTIASVVGVPPVLVAGIYGMNFRIMPELGWRLGYPMALGLIVASALAPLWWFKRRGWM
ncbi:MAG TPA: magnesium transporter CorA family protein [Polyangia bacterium]|nr:magnesium transporter CorA family protein [Polyangia bacterium]